MNRKVSLMVVVLGALLAASCGVYHPQMVQVPLTEHRGDAHVDLNLSTLGSNYSLAAVDFSASYGLTDWLTVQAAASGDFGSNYYGQAAIGWYRPLERNFVVEVYAGYGAGHGFDYLWERCFLCEEYEEEYPVGTRDFDDHDKTIRGSYEKYFVQVDAGWVSLAKGHIDLGTGLKVGLFRPNFVQYGDMHLERTGGLRNYRIFTDEEHYGHTRGMVEQIFQFRAGGERLKFSLQVGFAIIGEHPDEPMFDYCPFSISSGINYRF